MKNWMTTVGAIIGSALVVAGFIWPEKVDAATQVAVNSATNEILAGLGVIINILVGIFAKDPVVTLTVK